MASSPFQEHMLNLLSATGYVLDLKPDQLRSVKADKELKPFFDWFISYISTKNCITQDELEEFKALEEKGEVLCGEELEQALQEYHGQPMDYLVPYSESFREIIQEELSDVENDLSLKEKLHSALRSSVSSITDDIYQLTQELRIVEGQQTDLIKDIFCSFQLLQTKITEVKTILEGLKESLVELSQANEISTDEGIDTMLSDKLNISTCSLASITSVRSTTSSLMGSESTFLCKLPFHKYDKEHQRFIRSVDRILESSLLKVSKTEETENKIDLELENLKDRLFDLKRAHILSIAELEGIRAAREKLKDVNIEVCKRKKPTKHQLRNKFLGIEEEDYDLTESFERESLELNSACMRWAEHQTIKPVCDSLRKKIEISKYLRAKMDELTDIMKIKETADMTMCQMLEWEAEQVKLAIDLYSSMQEKLCQWQEASTRRLEIMHANIEDYAGYMVLPLEERCGLLQGLSDILECDDENVVSAINSLSENADAQHEDICQDTTSHIQALFSFGHTMEILYDKEVKKYTNLQPQSDPELFDSISKSLEELSEQLVDANLHCYALQDDEDIQEEKNKLQQILKTHMELYANGVSS